MARRVAERPKRPAGTPAAKRRRSPRPNVRRTEPSSRRATAVPAPRPSLRARLRAGRASLARGWERLRRPLLVGGKVLLVVAIVAGAVAIGRLIERHVETSPAFATRTIEIEGNERLSRRDVLESAGLAEGQNVFRVGPEDARARLVRHSWIAEAEVRRRLPDTFELRIRERRAAAVLVVEEQAYLVSEEGAVFKKAEPGDPIDLPVITGIDRKRFLADRSWRTSILLEAVALLHDYRGAGLWRREPIGEVHVEPDDDLTLYVGSDATQIHLGRGPYRQKLHKLRRVLDRLARREARPAYVYLDNVRRPDRVTVKLR